MIFGDLYLDWWTGRDSNPRPPGCKPGARTAELPALTLPISIFPVVDKPYSPCRGSKIYIPYRWGLMVFWFNYVGVYILYEVKASFEYV